MKIAVIGSGVVGQAAGKGLAKHDNAITFVDTNKKKIEELKESGSDAVLAKDYKKLDTDVTMICVSVGKSPEGADMTDFNEAIEAFAARLKGHDKYHVLVIRSTVPPKTTREFVLPKVEKVSKKKAGKDFGVVVQPEFLRTKNAEQDAARPWFILLGELDSRSGDQIEKLYRRFDCPIERVSLEEAEFEKYVHNALNATKIAFFNEMRAIAETEGWNAETVLEAAAESAEANWNPLYGLRNYGPFEGHGPSTHNSIFLDWSRAYGHDMKIVAAVLASNKAAASEASKTDDHTAGDEAVKTDDKAVSEDNSDKGTADKPDESVKEEKSKKAVTAAGAAKANTGKGKGAK